MFPDTDTTQRTEGPLSLNISQFVVGQMLFILHAVKKEKGECNDSPC